MKHILIYERLVQYILENQDRFYRIAYSYTRHQEDALDAVQSAVCKALEAYKGIKNADGIKTWFYRILIHECLIVLKKRKKVVLGVDATDQEAVYYEKGYEQGDEIEKELDKLDLDVQGIIKLRFFEETQQDTSEERTEKEATEEAVEEETVEKGITEETAQTTLKYEDNFAVDGKTAKEFAEKVKDATAKKDLDALAELTAFPVYVGLPNVNVVETKEDFLKLGSENVFTEELLKSIEMADIENLQPSMAGFSISDGGTANINFSVVDGVLAINGINY